MISLIAPLDPVWFRRAAEHQGQLTMPAGALGQLLGLGQQLCAIQETLTPRADPAAVIVMAGDHGIVAEGVSAYPQEVTGQMVANFLRGGAAVNVLARRQGAEVFIVDMGVKHPPAITSEENCHYLREFHIAPGTNNFVHGPAMTLDQAEQAMRAGHEVVATRLVPRGMRTVILGEMGIGNTTSASALAASLMGLPVADVTGRGTGVDDAGWRHKVSVIERVLRRHGLRIVGQVSNLSGQVGNLTYVHASVDTMTALSAVGGFEIAGLVGVALEAARRRMVIVLDGLISSVAGLVAARIDPAARDYFIASHRGVEPGQRAVLEALELEPLLDLELRLGEGTGGVLALNLVQCAADIMRDMATFDSAGVSRR